MKWPVVFLFLLIFAWPAIAQEVGEGALLELAGDSGPAELAGELVFQSAELHAAGLDPSGLLEQVLAGAWQGLALNPQLWVLVLLALFTVWRVINPLGAEKAFLLTYRYAAIAKQIGNDLFWAVEEAGRRGNMLGPDKRALFESLIGSKLQAAGLPVTAGLVREATQAADGQNARLKAGAAPDPLKPSATS